MAQCDICAEGRPSAFPCGTCGLRTCRRCAQRIVREYTHDSRCTRCDREWDPEESVARLGRTFWMRDFREVRRRHLLVHERSLLEGTVAQAHRVKVDSVLATRVRSLLRRIRRGEWQLVQALRAARGALHFHRNGGHATDVPDAPRRAEWTVRHCTHCGDSLDHSGRCTACARVTCRRCGEAADGDDHVCSTSALDTVRAIAETSRPCVRCNAPCERTEGCATVWCILCHTFWNWDTGRVIDTRHHVPHNPDHVAWLRQDRPREVGDIPCGGIPDDLLLHMTGIIPLVLGAVASDAMPVVFAATECIRRAQQLRQRYPRVWDPATVNVDARIALINGDADEASFTRSIERNERACRYRRCVGHVLETFVLSGTDLLQRFCNMDDTADLAVVQLVELRACINASLARLGFLYNRAVPHVDATWHWRVPSTRQPQG